MANEGGTARGVDRESGIVVVGVDGSSSSERALLWAQSYARTHQLRLRVVLASTDSSVIPMASTDPSWPWQFVQRRSTEEDMDVLKHLEASVADVLGDEPKVDLSFEIVDQAAAHGLIDVASEANAQLLVVGRRGLGGFKRLLLGSVSNEVATYAHCPVVVVGKPSEADPTDVVVVGVDGSTGSEQALRWAARHASAQGSELAIVHGWEAVPVPAGSLVASIPQLDSDRDVRDDNDVLARFESLVDEEFPELTVSFTSIEGYPSSALTSVSEDRRAALLVVGSRGLGGFASMMLGSVAHQCLQRAGLPVAIIRMADQE